MFEYSIVGESISTAVECGFRLPLSPSVQVHLLFEGIVAKRKDSFYESGKRSGARVKYKVNRGQEFVIGGYTPGNPFDALIVGYYEGERLLYAAKVRDGFVPLVRREMARRFKGLEIDTCAFTKNAHTDQYQISQVRVNYT